MRPPAPSASEAAVTRSTRFTNPGLNKNRRQGRIYENPNLSDPYRQHLHQALKDLDILVVQDLFLFETDQVADVVLVAVSLAEKAGTFANTERRFMKICRAVDPLAKLPGFKVSAVQLRKLEAWRLDNIFTRLHIY